MNNQYPKVSIVILNFHSINDTIECLESFKKITYPNYDIIIVQLKSAEEDAKILRNLYQNYIHIIEIDEDTGVAGVNNIGIKYALNKSADYVLLSMNDVIFDPNFLTEMVKVAENKPEIGLLSPYIYSYYEPHDIGYPFRPGWTTMGLLCIRNKIIQIATGIDLRKTSKFDKISSVNFSCGGSSLFKKKLLNTVGLLDPLFFWLAEDVDIWIRAIKKDFTFAAVPEARIWHKARGTSRLKTAFSWYYTIRSPIIFARKHFSKLYFMIYICYLFTFQIPFWILESVFSNKSTRFVPTIFKGIWDGFSIELKEKCDESFAISNIYSAD